MKWIRIVYYAIFGSARTGRDAVAASMLLHASLFVLLACIPFVDAARWSGGSDLGAAIEGDGPQLQTAPLDAPQTESSGSPASGGAPATEGNPLASTLGVDAPRELSLTGSGGISRASISGAGGSGVDTLGSGSGGDTLLAAGGESRDWSRFPWMAKVHSGTDAKRDANYGGSSSSFFGAKANGKRFAYVVDVSGSMDGYRFKRARDELRRTITALSSEQNYYVVFFNHEAYPMPEEEMTPAIKSNLDKTWKWVRKMQCGGGTNPLPGLLLALDQTPDAIFLLTDGIFSPYTLAGLAKAQTDPPVPIHTIGFEDREGEELLKEISRQTGGEYHYVP